MTGGYGIVANGLLGNVAVVRAATDFEERALRLSYVTGQPVEWCWNFMAGEARVSPLDALDVADRIIWWASLRLCPVELTALEAWRFYQRAWW